MKTRNQTGRQWTADSDAATPGRTDLRRTLRYRQDLRSAVQAACALLAIGLLGLLVYLVMNGPKGSAMLAFPLAAAGIAFAFPLFFEVRGLGAAPAPSKVHVDEEGFTFEREGAESRMLFKDVRAAVFSRTPFFGGAFTLVMATGRRHRFTVALERSDYVLESIARARPELLRASDLRRSRRMTVLSDHVIGRIDGRVQEGRKLFDKYVLYPVLLFTIFVGALVLRRKLQMHGSVGGPAQLSASGCAFVLLMIVTVNAAVRGALEMLSELLLTRLAWKTLTSNPTAVRRDGAREEAHGWSVDFAHRWIALGFIAACFAMRWYQ